MLKALKERGFTQEELAKRFLTTQQSVSRWERGERTPSGPAMLLIRELAAESGLIPAEMPPEKRVVPIVGKIGAGAEIEPDFEQAPPEGFEQVELPYPVPGNAEMIGFRVVGDSMAPAYEEDALILVEKEPRYTAEGMTGLAAAIVAYGPAGERRRYLKRIKLGSRRNLYDLESINDRSPTIHDVQIAWASPVCFIIPNIGLRRVKPDRRARVDRAGHLGKGKSR